MPAPIATHTFDEDLGAIEADFRYYYDCLMAPNARSVLSALKRMGELGNNPRVTVPCCTTMLMNSLDATALGAKRKRRQKRLSPCFISQIGSDRLSQSIASGITKTGVNVEMIDLRSAEPQEVQELISRCAELSSACPNYG